MGLSLINGEGVGGYNKFVEKYSCLDPILFIY